ncbi:MAG: hypothetical protein QXL96_00575, partial [Ignisphaera sp.]
MCEFLPSPAVSIHVNTGIQTKIICKLIEESIVIGAKIIRFDIWWKDIEPSQGTLFRPSLCWYKELIEYIVQKGLEPLLVLGTGLPRWFISLIRKNKKHNYLIDYVYDYAYNVSKFLKPYVTMYQLGNELNLTLNNTVLRNIGIDFVEALCRGIIDGTGGKLQVINITIDYIGWRKFLHKALTKLRKCVDIIGIDHYPKTWSLSRYDDWRILKSIYKDIKRYNKSLAITETGFATELRFLNKIVIKREHEQMKFINKTFSSITSIACEIPVMFIVWYMLWDEDPMSCEPFSGLGGCGWGVL